MDQPDFLWLIHIQLRPVVNLIAAANNSPVVIIKEAARTSVMTPNTPAKNTKVEKKTYK
ncbi:hypothetical protein [Halobacillus sp. A5]|uniref:hypothetical protein n=1 Tax=Halobacillus sp. A5 TaxID=2880263 RepID=UPI0020A6717D|nr:hypothetical protein [Halobacillus sp. A5]MCP3026472.1 hypothetical protein [Halobacillus sp. A5]